MGNFVLVHGSWHGSWCWQFVESLLRRQGHQVVIPTLTGLGDRSHLLSSSIDLSTHIEDVRLAMHYADVSGAILVGHSYSGLVLGGVAEKSLNRISQLVFLDALIPKHGHSGFDLLPEIEPIFTGLANEQGAGWLVPPFAPEVLGVTDPVLAEWMRTRLCPMPIKTHQERMNLPSKAYDSVPCHFIRCTEFPRFADIAEQAKSDGYSYWELSVGHDAMVIQPDSLSKLLNDISQTTS